MKLNVKKYLPILFLFLISIIPVIIWAFMEPIASRFLDVNSTMTSFGQITGLLGMMLFSVNLILSNRSVFFDKIFSGLHHFYNAHKWLGTLSFSLLLFHPLFLVVKYIGISLNSAAMFLIPSGNLPVTMGIIGLSGMILLLVITFYLKIKYHIWRMSHKFMVFVFVFAILHTILISSDISRDLFLRSYILFFAFVGLLSGGYRAFFRSFFNQDFKYKVVATKILNDKVIEIEVSPISEILQFNPGQFIFIRFIDKSISPEPHPFSIASTSDANGILKVVIKSLGDFTNKLSNIKVGTLAKIEGPFGSFFQKNDFKKEIWIAGGVGITPFLSKARGMKNLNHEVDLYYCLNQPSEAVLLDELFSIANLNPKFKVIPWYSKEKGYLNGSIVMKTSTNTSSSDIYICGPLVFMRSLEDQFINLGVEKNNIYFEEFNFL